MGKRSVYEFIRNSGRIDIAKLKESGMSMTTMISIIKKSGRAYFTQCVSVPFAHQGYFMLHYLTRDNSYFMSYKTGGSYFPGVAKLNGKTYYQGDIERNVDSLLFDILIDK